MKRKFHIIVFPLLVFSLLSFYGCPVGNNFPPDTPGTVKINNALLGTWTCVMDTCSDLQVVKVEKEDSYTYNIQVLGKGDMYMVDDDQFKGYVTKIDGIDILYALEESTGQYYSYHYVVSGNKLTLYDLSLLKGGMDAVTSTETYRAEVTASSKMEGFLKEPTHFSKE